jgi:hypothetical protein
MTADAHEPPLFVDFHLAPVAQPINFAVLHIRKNQPVILT